MSIEKIVESVKNLSGNYCRSKEEIYIPPTNMKNLVQFLENYDDVHILITPYLINSEGDAVYELHYYEFELEVTDVTQSYYVEYAEGNGLPSEIIDNIKPRAIVAKNDKQFLVIALQNYLKAMDKMMFEEDRNSDKSLENSMLFYQIF